MIYHRLTCHCNQSAEEWVRLPFSDCSPSNKNLMHFAETITLHEGLLHKYIAEMKWLYSNMWYLY